MRRFASLTALLIAAAGPAAAAEVEALGGATTETIRAIEPEGGKLVVRTAGRTIPLDSVKAIRFQPEAPLGPAAGASKLVLLGGDWLVGAVEGGDADAVALRSESLGALRVPLEQVRAVLPRLAPERERELLARLDETSELDWVLLDNGGTAKGTILELDGTHVALDTRREMVGPGGSGIGVPKFDFEKVQLVSIVPLGDPPPEPQGLAVVVRLLDGSRLSGELQRLGDGKLVLRHALGGGEPLELSLPRVASLSVQNGRFVYLSDLQPVEVDQRFPPEYTYEPKVWHFKRDANVTGGRLRLGGRDFSKGLGVHSYCALTYELGGEYQQFRAVVGLDDQVRYLGEPGFGGVVFRVLLDGKPAREHTTGIHVRKGDEPVEVVVDVAGKRTLTLVADFDPTALHVLGRADWADAHLVK